MKSIHEQVVKLSRREDLSLEETEQAMQLIMQGEVDAVELSAFLVALRMKGESSDEITGLARVMREQANPVNAVGEILDCCGTGGDGANTFNISTAVALLSAAAGIRIAKHGNKSISSRSGSSDVLQALGIPVQCIPEQAEHDIEEHNFAFLFAPLYHPAMKHVMPVRRTLGIRTVFNLLGPLTNPARPCFQLLGVYAPELTLPIAEVLKQTGCKAAMVVHGAGTDEIALHGDTIISQLRDGQISTYTITPEDLGLSRCCLTDIQGGDADQNADIIRAIFRGSDRGPRRSVTLINSAAALLIAGKVKTLKAGLAMAAGLIDSGQAAAKLKQLSRSNDAQD